MRLRRGIAHLLPLVIIAILLVAVPLLIYKFVLKKNLPFVDKQPNVALKTEYANPFDKKTQYVNPFDESKNPFVDLE